MVLAGKMPQLSTQYEYREKKITRNKYTKMLTLSLGGGEVYLNFLRPDCIIFQYFNQVLKIFQN